MLSLGLFIFLVAIPLFSYSITPSLFNRITSLLLLFSALLSFHALSVESVASGVGIFSGLFQVTQISLGMEAFLLVTGALLLLGWAPVTSTQTTTTTAVPTISEYSLLILFTTMGSCFLVSCSDLLSLYLCIELQSFAVYVLSTLYRNSESATSAGLKYFLLGALSSALILLGAGMIYSYTGLTQFEGIYTLCQASATPTETPFYLQAVILGAVLIGVGLLFKVASAPFHNWAPDVYDGVPTVVTSWLITMPKIAIFVFLLELQVGLGNSFSTLSLLSDTNVNVWKNLLLVASLLSLVVGTVVGLSQYRIKRLLAYSTISHVGFLLLALSINTEDSIETFLFYLIQYSLTNVAAFLTLLAFGYSMRRNGNDIVYIKELAGEFQNNPLLSCSLALCLFSMAGIPPLIGFFAKQMLLYSSVHAGYYFLSIVAVVVSVISASYYLKIVRVLYFDTTSETGESSISTTNGITTIHSLLIAMLTMVLTFFLLHPTILLNSCHLLALSLFTN